MANYERDSAELREQVHEKSTDLPKKEDYSTVPDLVSELASSQGILQYFKRTLLSSSERLEKSPRAVGRAQEAASDLRINVQALKKESKVVSTELHDMKTT